MADNTTLDPGAGGDTIGADDIGGVKFQRVKLIEGADGVNDGDVSAANPLPVQDPNAHSFDYDTGAGTDTTTAAGLVVPASGGALVVGGTSDGTHAGMHAVIRDAAGNARGANVNASSQLSVSVDAITALAAGTNNIGDVDVLSVIPGTGATNLGKAEDAAHSTGDVGVMALGIRDDTLSVFSGTEGDYEPFHMTATGRLYTSATIDTALPAGTNNIGDVDILTIIPGTGATNLGKAEDAAHTTGDVGVMMLGVYNDADALLVNQDLDYCPIATTQEGWVRVSIAEGAAGGGTEFAEDTAHSTGALGTMVLAVRNDAMTALAGTDGDYIPLTTDASGALFVTNADSLGLAPHIDDAAFTVASDIAFPVGGIFDDTTPDSVDEGDFGVFRMSSRRELYTQIRDAAGNERGANVNASNRLTVSVDNVVDASGSSVSVSSVVAGTGATNLGKAEDAAHSSGDTGVMMLGVRDDTLGIHSGTDGDYEPMHLTAAGRLYTSATIDAALPAGTNNIGDVDVLSIVPGTAATNLGKAEDAGHSTGDTGVMALAVRNDAGTAVAGTTLDYIPLTTDANGALWCTQLPGTTGGYTIFRSLDLDETEEDVKTSAGQLYGYFIHNAAATTRFVKWYNATAASVTVGSTTPVMTMPIPAGASANIEFANGIAFSTAICVAATTGGADADTGAPSANDVYVNILYK